MGIDYVTWIRKGLQRPGKSQNGLAEVLGRSPSVVSNMLKPGGRKLKLAEVPKVSAYFGIPAPNLVEDTEAEFAESLRAGEVSTMRPYEARLPGASPDIDASAGAGPGGLPLPASTSDGAVVFSADAVRGEIVLPEYMLSEFTRAKPSRIHWVRVRGDSMVGTLDPGDRVGVDTTDTAIGQGGVFVIRDADGEILVKRLRKVRPSDGIEIEIVSDNPKQGNEVVPSESIAIIGRVVAKISRVG